MKNFFSRNHEPIKILTETSLTIINFMVIGHVYTLATLAAGVVMVAYVTAAIFKARESAHE